VESQTKNGTVIFVFQVFCYYLCYCDPENAQKISLIEQIAKSSKRILTIYHRLQKESEYELAKGAKGMEASAEHRVQYFRNITN
ncbi:hypothetical protein WUBG_04881, partial [Wuchereria bancrofti]